MAKIVKFCNSCEESFAEKFGFCPNCGDHLQAFEMNPLAANNGVSAPVKSETSSANDILKNETYPAEPIKSAPKVSASSFTVAPVADSIESPLETKKYDAAEIGDVLYSADADAEKVEEKVLVIEPEKPAEKLETPLAETKTYTAGAGAAATGYNGYQETANRNDFNYSGAPTKFADDGFHITVIEEKNSKQRNVLLLGALVLMTTMAVSGTVYSLFNKDLFVGSIGDEGNLSALVAEVEPPVIETEPPPKPEKDKGGGGGGGGKENPEPVNKGRLPNQVEKPIMPPQPLPQVTNASLPNPNETQGKIKREKTSEPVGLPSGLSDKLSSGLGSGGGIGSGRGTGVGGGIGTGEGNGIGSGSGNGRGNGTGDGTGDGGNRPNGVPPPPPAAKPKVTQAMRIVSKPRANYTDAARTNQVQGTVTLRVTFLPSGQIGSISPVNGLPYGLTEQAIAAARSIKFEPQMVNGSPVAVTKQVQYSFTIY